MKIFLIIQKKSVILKLFLEKKIPAKPEDWGKKIIKEYNLM